MHPRGGSAAVPIEGTSNASNVPKVIIIAVICGCLLSVIGLGAGFSVTPATGGSRDYRRGDMRTYLSTFAADSHQYADFAPIDPKCESTFSDQDEENVVLERLDAKIKISTPHVLCPTETGRRRTGSMLSSTRATNLSACRRAALTTERGAMLMNLRGCDDTAASVTGSGIAERSNPSPKPRLRLLCITYTVIKGHPKAEAMYKTWGSHCDQHLIFTNGTVIDGVPQESVVHSLPAVHEESYNNLWMKIVSIHDKMLAFRFPAAPASRPLNNTDWFASQFAVGDISKIRIQPFDYVFVGGDDVFLFVPNLRRYLTEHSYPQQMEREGGPLFFGYRYDLELFSFVSGAGYVMNEFAFLQFVGVAEPLCDVGAATSQEDVTTALCFGHVGVETVDARDEYGENRFVPLRLVTMMYQSRGKHHLGWYQDYHGRPQEKAPDILSQYVTLLHYMDVNSTHHYYDSIMAPLCCR